MEGGERSKGRSSGIIWSCVRGKRLCLKLLTQTPFHKLITVFFVSFATEFVKKKQEQQQKNRKLIE